MAKACRPAVVKGEVVVGRGAVEGCCAGCCAGCAGKGEVSGGVRGGRLWVVVGRSSRVCVFVSLDVDSHTVAWAVGNRRFRLIAHPTEYLESVGDSAWHFWQFERVDRSGFDGEDSSL